MTYYNVYIVRMEYPLGQYSSGPVRNNVLVASTLSEELARRMHERLMKIKGFEMPPYYEEVTIVDPIGADCTDEELENWLKYRAYFV